MSDATVPHWAGGMSWDPDNSCLRYTRFTIGRTAFSVGTDVLIDLGPPQGPGQDSPAGVSCARILAVWQPTATPEKRGLFAPWLSLGPHTGLYVDTQAQGLDPLTAHTTDEAAPGSDGGSGFPPCVERPLTAVLGAAVVTDVAAAASPFATDLTSSATPPDEGSPPPPGRCLRCAVLRSGVLGVATDSELGADVEAYRTTLLGCAAARRSESPVSPTPGPPVRGKRWREPPAPTPAGVAVAHPAAVEALSNRAAALSDQATVRCGVCRATDDSLPMVARPHDLAALLPAPSGVSPVKGEPPTTPVLPGADRAFPAADPEVGQPQPAPSQDAAPTPPLKAEPPESPRRRVRFAEEDTVALVTPPRVEEAVARRGKAGGKPGGKRGKRPRLDTAKLDEMTREPSSSPTADQSAPPPAPVGPSTDTAASDFFAAPSWYAAGLSGDALRCTAEEMQEAVRDARRRRRKKKNFWDWGKTQ